MNHSEVYFAPLNADSTNSERSEAVNLILNSISLDQILKAKAKVGIKTHFGEVKNDTHIAPEIIRIVVDKCKEYKSLPFVMETATLYSGPRNNAISHIEHAYDHGFTYSNINAPIIMADGLLRTNNK